MARDDGAVVHDAGLEIDVGRVSGIRCHELLGIAHDHLDGTAGRVGDEVHQGHVHEGALAAEVAADVGDVDPDAVRLDARNGGHLRL